jgi:hypothetical protein
MNKTTTAQQGQSFLDIVLQSTGNLEDMFEMAMINDIAITDDLEIGETIQITTITNKYIVSQWQEGKEPATAIDSQTVILKEGLEYWAIENYPIQ